jgi:hypothetical protein
MTTIWNTGAEKAIVDLTAERDRLAARVRELEEAAKKRHYDNKCSNCGQDVLSRVVTIDDYSWGEGDVTTKKFCGRQECQGAIQSALGGRL